MFDPPPSFLDEIGRRSETHLPCRPALPLQQAIATYYNTCTPNFTKPSHVVVGTHTRALLFLLHLAAKTFNECAVATQPKLALRMSAATASVDPAADPVAREDPREDPKGDHVIRVCSMRFPSPTESIDEVTTRSQPHIVVSEMPELLTHGKWGCAFAVFPNIARSNHQTLCTALRGILLELQDELGAYPVPGVQRGALLAFSPWMLSYATRYDVLANGLSRYVADSLRKRGIGDAVVSAAARDHRDYVGAAVQFRFECTSAKDAERVRYLVDACLEQAHTSAATKNVVSVSLPLRTFLPNGQAVLAELPESSCCQRAAESRRANAPLRLPSTAEEVAPWVPTADFVEEWCPLVRDCVRKLAEVLG
jgi:hypothetical protein